MKNYSIIYLLIALLFAACKKDVVEFIPDEVETPAAVYVMTDLGGMITDEEQTPLANVTIQISTRNGLVETATDENGIFLIRDIEVQKDRLYVKAFSEGFFVGSKTIEVAGNAIENIEIRLLQKQLNYEFDSNIGGVITTNDGARVTFGPNVIADSNGNPYNGNVLVAMRWLNPTSADIFQIMPGNLIGEDSLGRAHVMATAGMIGVELFSNNFEKLNILEGQTATLEFPVPSSIANKVPSEIPLWSFDENKGVWILEGTAQYADNQYTATVSHFSFWNCDAIFPLINGQGKVVDANGNPIANALVKISIGGLNTRSGWTNSEGVFSGKLPANETIEIAVCDACGDPLGSATTITTSDMDLTIPDITVNGALNVTQIFGMVVDCEEAPVANGYVSITSGSIAQHVFLDGNGQFDNTFLFCDESELKLIAVDIDNEKTSPENIFQIAPMIDADTIEACDEFAEFISFTLDGGGTNTLYADPISVTGGFTLSEGLEFYYFPEGFSFAASNPDMEVNQSYPVTFMMIPGISDIVDYQVEVVLTELGNQGELMEGTFMGTFGDNTGAAHTINGSFKIIRDF